MSKAPNALEVRNVTRIFPTPEGTEVRALDDVSLNIIEGSFTVLLGPSGCGKTTLLRCIAGLESPDHGEIFLRGVRIDGQPVWQRRVNTVFQSYALFPHMSVAENIAFGLQMDKVDKKTIEIKVTEALAMVHLEGLEKRRPAQLSGGQQQRVALARALAKQPDVLLLDEPLSALDLKLRRGMQLELKRLQRETNITFVLVTHDQEEAMAMGDTVAVFDSGRIAQIGEPRDVYLAPATRFVADFIGEANVLACDSEGRNIKGLGAVPRDWIVNTSSAAKYAAVRPEAIRFTKDNTGTGTITDVTFIGGDVNVTVDLGGQPLRARVAQLNEIPFRIGERVSVTCESGSIRLLES